MSDIITTISPIITPITSSISDLLGRTYLSDDTVLSTAEPFDMSKLVYTGPCVGSGKKLCYKSTCYICSSLKQRIESIVLSTTVLEKETKDSLPPKPVISREPRRNFTSYKFEYGKELLEQIYGDNTEGQFVWIATSMETDNYYLYHEFGNKYWSVCPEDDVATIVHTLKPIESLCFSRFTVSPHTSTDFTYFCGRDIVSKYYCLTCYNICDDKTCTMCHNKAYINKYYCNECLEEYVEWHHGHHLHRYYTFHDKEAQFNDIGEIVPYPVFISRSVDDEGNIEYHFP